MAGKKRIQSRSGARKAQFVKRAGTKKVNGKSCGGKITADNIIKRALKHIKLVEREAGNKAETTKLFEQVCAKYNLDSKGKYALKRLCGTCNRSRMSSLLDGSYKKSTWFIKRSEHFYTVDKEGNTIDTNASKLIKSTKLGRLLS